MRAVAFAFALAACGQPPSDTGCKTDRDCGGLACARNGECLPAARLRTVHVTWTIRGGMANATSCGSSQDLYLMFYGFDQGDTFGFEPVPCAAGLFTIDKLPDRYTSVEIGDNNRVRVEKVIDAQGAVAFDLLP